MPDNGLRALVFIRTPTTSLAAALTVPTGKEWALDFVRATNIAAADTTVTVSVGNNGEIAFNAPIKVGEALNVLGPDRITLPAGTVVNDRAATGGSIRMVYNVIERDVA